MKQKMIREFSKILQMLTIAQIVEMLAFVKEYYCLDD